MIKDIGHVVFGQNKLVEEFHKEVWKHVKKFQDNGFVVEIQYQQSSAGLSVVYSALIIGRTHE